MNKISGQIALFTAGPIGAGKSTCAEILARRFSMVSLDPDHIQEYVSQFRSDTDQARVRLVALRLLERWQDVAIAEHRPLIVNTTAADLVFVRRMRLRLHEHGYRCAMIFIASDQKACLRRNDRRRMPRPDAVARCKFVLTMKNRRQLKNEFPDFLEIANDSTLEAFRRRVRSVAVPWFDNLRNASARSA